jgi:hypothetical protein
MALTRGDRRRRYQSAETMAGVVAERLMDALEKGGFVIMRKPRSRRPRGQGPTSR